MMAKRRVENELVYEQTQINYHQQQEPVTPVTVWRHTLTIPNLSNTSTGDWNMISQGGSLPVPNTQPRPTRAARPYSWNDSVDIDVDAAFDTFVGADLKSRQP